MRKTWNQSVMLCEPWHCGWCSATHALAEHVTSPPQRLEMVRDLVRENAARTFELWMPSWRK